MRSSHQICASITDICNVKNGHRDRQLLLGNGFDVIESSKNWAFGYSLKDGYKGYVKEIDLEPFESKTHWIKSLGTHAYIEPNIKSTDQIFLPFGSQINVISKAKKFVKTKHGFIPEQHTLPIGSYLSDAVQVATKFLGAPYLWGGNSINGIDCSGLIQAACLACGMKCPGDSDLQELFFPEVKGPWCKGQLIFWKGHVALTISDTELIHANATAMSVTIEGIEATLGGIDAAGDGPVTHRSQIQL